MEQSLYKRTKTGAIQIWSIDSGNRGYIIEFGQLHGKKQTIGTEIISGKQKRTKEEQIELEVKALIKSKKDEGYKSLDDLVLNPEIEIRLQAEGLQRFLDNHLPKFDTDKNGNLRPMLAKVIDDKHTIFPIAYEDKLDGVRCNILQVPVSRNDTIVPNGLEVISLAREGGSYDFGTRDIREQLKEFFAKFPHVILDGELYLHGLPQNQISGAMRGTTYNPQIHDIMQYHVYDMIDTDLNYEERKDWLIENLPKDKHLIVFHDYKLAMSKEDLDFYEEESIENGYEGGVAKPLKGKYEPGKRSWNNLKIKRWLDEEFRIDSYELGKRGIQDLVFIMSTKDGKQFKATACGTIQEKNKMVNDMLNDMDLWDEGKSSESKYLKQMGTVKFKFYSEYGIPNHSTFKGVRKGKN